MYEKMSYRKKMTLSDIAKELKVKKFTLKSWERMLYDNNDKSNKPESAKKQLYSPQEAALFAQLKQLVHDQGLPLEQAKELLVPSTTSASITLYHDSAVVKTLTETIANAIAYEALPEPTSLVTQGARVIAPESMGESTIPCLPAHCAHPEFTQKIAALSQELGIIKKQLMRLHQSLLESK